MKGRLVVVIGIIILYDNQFITGERICVND
jgi:hypothetical protein